MADERVEAVEALLRREGIEGAQVSAAGGAGEIAALSVEHRHAARLAALAPAIKALGFKYVALDLAGGGAG
jgi:hypothetical protein